jgi:hypothetical protein
LAIALNEVSTTHRGENQMFSADNWLNATATVFMHHNKYELGPDRFNENVFIYYLSLFPIPLNTEGA